MVWPAGPACVASAGRSVSPCDWNRPRKSPPKRRLPASPHEVPEFGHGLVFNNVRNGREDRLAKRFKVQLAGLDHLANRTLEAVNRARLDLRPSLNPAGNAADPLLYRVLRQLLQFRVQLFRPDRGHLRKWPRRRADRDGTRRRRRSGPRAAPPLPHAGQRIPAGQRADVQQRQLTGRLAMDGKMLARLGAVVFVAIAVTATAIDMARKDEPSAPPPACLPSSPRPVPCATLCAPASSSARRRRVTPTASPHGRNPATASSAAHQRPQRGRPAKGADHEKHGRHRQFPRGIHVLHRQRIRPAVRRSRLHCHHVDRHRRDARRAFLGMGRG